MAKKKTSKAAKKKAVKKAPVKKSIPPKKPVARKKNVAKKPAAKKVPAKKEVVVKEKKPPKKKKIVSPLKAKEKREFRKLLLTLRDRYVQEVGFLAGDNLNRSSRESSGKLSNYGIQTDQGTDNFDRELALNLVSGEQDIIYEIDEALRRLDINTYGVCEYSEEPIEIERLRAIPYARHSIKAQTELEKGRTKFRPFGPTISKVP